MLQQKSLHLGMVFTLLLLQLLWSPSAIASNSMVGECLQNKALCQENIEADAEEEQTESASVSIGIMDYIKIFFALAAVLALLIFVLKLLNKRNLTYQQASSIRNIGGISVGAQKSVQVIQIGNSVYVVGVGDEVRLLKEIEDEQEKEQLLAMFNEKQVAASTMPYIFELFSSKMKPKQQPTDTTRNFNDEFKRRIDEIKQQRSEHMKLDKSEEERDRS